MRLQISQCLRLISLVFMHFVHSNLITSTFTSCNQLHSTCSLLPRSPSLCFYFSFLFLFEKLAPLFKVASRYNSWDKQENNQLCPPLLTKLFHIDINQGGGGRNASPSKRWSEAQKRASIWSVQSMPNSEKQTMHEF